MLMSTMRRDDEGATQFVAWERRRQQNNDFSPTTKVEWQSVQGSTRTMSLMYGLWVNRSGGFGEEARQRRDPGQRSDHGVRVGHRARHERAAARAPAQRAIRDGLVQTGLGRRQSCVQDRRWTTSSPRETGLGSSGWRRPTSCSSPPRRHRLRRAKLAKRPGASRTRFKSRTRQWSRRGVSFI